MGANESVQNASIPPQVEQVAVTLKDTFEDVFQQASVAMGGFFSQLFPPAAPADPVSKRPFYEDDVRFQCSFVSDVTMLDGDCVEPSGTFTKSWMIMNSGTSAWPTGCYVAYVGGDNLVPTSAPKRVAVGGIPSRSRTVASISASTLYPWHLYGLLPSLYSYPWRYSLRRQTVVHHHCPWSC